MFMITLIVLEGSLVAGAFVSLSDPGTFLIRLPTFVSFSKILDGLKPGTYFFTLDIFMIFMILLFL